MFVPTYHSPWNFNNTKPSERPNNVIPKHVTAALTISAFAYGKIFKNLNKDKTFNQFLNVLFLKVIHLEILITQNLVKGQTMSSQNM